MVKLQPIIFCMLILTLSIAVFNVDAQLVYHLEHEGVKIWINQDGTIDLLYDIEISADVGTLHWVEIGQPNGDFTIGQAFDENGNELSTKDTSSGGDYKVEVDVVDLPAGESVRFNLTTNVGRMIFEDNDNPGNVGMKFTPSWFQVAINNLRVRIVLPPGVTENDVKTLTGVDWDSADYADGNFAVYWERNNLAPDQKYTFGVSFPKEYVERWETQPGFLQAYGLWIGVLAVLALVVGLVVLALRKKPYLKPVLGVEALGIRRGLTAVEAAYLLDLKPSMIVTEILYGLLRKRAVWVTASKPSVKIEVMKQFKRGQKAEGQAGSTLRYYEIDFLNAMTKDGTLDEKLLAEAITFLGRSVEEKMRGYCRRDTIEYYRKIAKKAWTQVEQAGTSELASKLYDEQLLWLLLDPRYQAKTEAAFKDRIFEPSPLWLWYWYSYQHYHPRPTYEPNVDAPTQGSPPKIPGAEFADNIATAVENTSNSIVANLEKFANSIIPTSPPPKTSHKPAHRKSSCVCACAACACACACVSCACACAGGGAG